MKSAVRDIARGRALLPPPAARVPVVLAAVSAFAATVHEVVWSHSVGRLVGNTSWSITLTLAFFMVGMGVGSAWGHRLLSRRLMAPRVAYAVAELAIAATALAAHLVFLEAALPSASVGLAGDAGLVLDVAVGSALLLVPATAMGATYPLLLRATPTLAGRGASLVYAAGLVGGVCGVLAAALWIAPLMGLDSGYGLAAALNVVVAAGALGLLPRRDARRGSPVARGAVGTGDGLRLVAFSAAALVGMGAQVVWVRAVTPFAGVSTFTFSAIVAVYLCSQALAFRVFRRRAADARIGPWALLVLPLALAPSVVIPAFMADLIPERSAGSLGFAVAVVAVVASATALPAFLTGLVQASALGGTEGDRAGVASRAGRIVGLGTLVGAAGALITGFALLPALGPWRSLVALSFAGSLGGVTLLRGGRRRPAAAVVVLAAALLLVEPSPRVFVATGLEDAEVLYVEHGVEDTTAVVELDHPLEGRVRRIVTGGVSYSGDSIAAQRYMRLLAHLPALAAARRDRALVVCVGTGTTVASLTRHPFERIDAVDISPTVLDATAYFHHVNDGLHDPRVRLVVADGHRFLRSRGARYDVITLEPPPPRAPGGSVLYGEDFYRAARHRLREGGVVAQWLPLHGMTAWEVDRLVATFLGVFPEGRLYLAERNEAILLGAAATLPDAAPDEVLREPAVAREIARLGLGDRSPLRELLVGGAEALDFVTLDAEPVSFSWPAPEHAPFAVPAGSPSLDAWLRALADRDAPQGPPTDAAAMLRAAPAFARVKAGGGTAQDKQEVLAHLLELLRARPDDPYVQYVFGYGPLLDARLDRLGSGAAFLDTARDAARARHREQAAWARTLLAERASR